MKVFIEAAGCIDIAYIIRACIQADLTPVLTDMEPDLGGFFPDFQYLTVPPSSAESHWNQTLELISDNQIDIVLPYLDENLLGWQKVQSENPKLKIIISPRDTLETFLDKWQTYEFFKRCNIPTPETSLKDQYDLHKPRLGRGSKGIYIKSQSKQNYFDHSYLSQEFIDGQEFSIDCLFDLSGSLVYTVARKRLRVKDGKSTAGLVVQSEEFNKSILRMTKTLHFIGPINFQAIVDSSGKIFFIECNPRLAGGMALSFEASENWISVIANQLQGLPLKKPKRVKLGMRMMRYYNELFTE